MFGIAMIVVGILVPLFTTTWYREWLTDVLTWDMIAIREVRYFDSPYLGSGVILVGIGIALTVFSEILFREWEKASLTNALTAKDT